MFYERVFDKNEIEYNKKTIILENIKTFFAKTIIKFIII